MFGFQFLEVLLEISSPKYTKGERNVVCGMKHLKLYYICIYCKCTILTITSIH